HAAIAFGSVGTRAPGRFPVCLRRRETFRFEVRVEAVRREVAQGSGVAFEYQLVAACRQADPAVVVPTTRIEPGPEVDGPALGVDGGEARDAAQGKLRALRRGGVADAKEHGDVRARRREVLGRL